MVSNDWIYNNTNKQDRNPLEKHLVDVVNKCWNFANRCEGWKDHVTNAYVGLMTESGEVGDVHKKWFYHKEKDRRAELIDEIGDVCFYLAKLLELHNITLEECLEANKQKLTERYKEAF